MGINDPNGELS
jgi:hypothetical protein